MSASIEDIKKTPIGENTAKLIANIRNLQAIYSDVYDVMASIYGDRIAESLFNDKFNDAYFDLGKAIKDFLMLSIDESLSNRNLKEI